MVKKVLIGLLMVSVASVWGAQDPERPKHYNTLRKKIDVPTVRTYKGPESKSVVVSEDFESGEFPPSGWAQYRTGCMDGPGWQLTDSESHSGSYSVYHDDDNVSNDNEDWLVTPAITIPSGAMGAYISFYTMTKYAPWATNYRGIWVSAGSPDPADGDYAELIDLSDSSWYSWSQVTFDLSQFAGQTIYIAFRYVGDWADEWYIDDVEIESGTPATPDVLVVDDEPYGFGQFFAYYLYNNGYTFDYFDVPDSGRGPSLGEMQSYKAVIWTTGSEWSSDNVVVDEYVDTIQAYIDNGGHFWFSSQDFLYFIYDFIPSWLPVDDYVYDAYTNGDYDVSGVTGSSIGEGLSFSVSQNYAYNYIDALTPSPGAQAEFATGGSAVAVSYNGSKGGKVFFNAFVFANIVPEEMMDSLLVRVMNYFGISPNPEFYNAGIGWARAEDVWEDTEVNIDARVDNLSPQELYIPVVVEIYDTLDNLVYSDMIYTDLEAFGSDTVSFSTSLPVGVYHGVVYTALPADQDHSTDTATVEFKVAAMLQAPFVDGMDNLNNWIEGGDGAWDVVQQEGYVELTRGAWERGNTYIVAKIDRGTELYEPKLFFKWSSSSLEDYENDYLYVEISRDGATWTVLDSLTGNQDWVTMEYLLGEYGIESGDTFYLRFRVNANSDWDHAYIDSVGICEGYIPNDAEIADTPNPELWDSTIVDTSTNDTLPVFTGVIMTPSVTITNGGNPAGDPSISFRVFYKIFDPNGILVYSQIRTYRGLRPGDTANIYFPGFIPAHSGIYRLTVTVRCPNDPELNNNTFNTKFYVPPHKSAAGENSIPQKLMLNVKPFAGGGEIVFGLPAESHVKVSVFDMSGRVVDVPVNSSFNAGYHAISWKAPHSGVYLFHVKTDTGELSQRVVIVK